MLDVLDHLTDILIGIAILFLVPLIYIGLKQDELIRTVVSEQTEKLMDDTSSLGYLSKDMYEEFQQALSKTGLLYDIKLEHKQKIIEPEYRFRTVDEVLEEQNKAFNGTNEYHYYPVSTNIPVVTDPIDNSGLTMNTETNESVLAGTVHTPADGHVHSDACYAGHKHTGSKTFTHVHAHSGCYSYTGRIFYDMKCNSCKKTYRWLTAVYYWSPATGLQTSYVNTSGMNTCVYCSSSSMSVVTQYNEPAYSCGYSIDENGDGLYDTVANGVSKTYYGRSTPQSTAQATYTSGCYTYHNTTSYKDLGQWIYSPYYPPYMNNAAQVFGTLYLANFQGYCILPATVNKTYKYDGMTFMAITYTPVIQPDGTVLFNYAGHQTYYHQWGGPHTFPSGITAAQLADIFNNMTSSFQKYVGESYNTNNGTTSISLGGEVTACSFNHVLGVNQWITTCGQVENATLACNLRVVNISPTHPVQSVYTNEPLITTITATYQDGSKKIILAKASFSTATPMSNQTVTLTYTDAQGNTLTCPITVNVIPRNKTCSHGHLYNLNYDGSDPGCPFCKSWLASLSIEFPTTPTFTIYRGTTLSDNGVTLLATYLDGHTELLESEYLDNLDKNYVGSQYVTLSYKGHYVYFTVVTRRNMKLCSICKRHYELHPDDTDPGCPWCAARTPIFTGNVMQYDIKNYSNEILSQLFEGDEVYRFSDGDFLNISVKSRRGSIGTRLLSSLYDNNIVNTIHVIKSGSIREDGYYYK